MQQPHNRASRLTHSYQCFSTLGARLLRKWWQPLPLSGPTPHSHRAFRFPRCAVVCKYQHKRRGGCIASLQQGRSDRLGRRSSRSITSLQQGRSGRLCRRPSRSITALRQGGVDAGMKGREILITPASYHEGSSASATRSTEQFGTSTVSRSTLKSRTTMCKTNYTLFHVSLSGGC